jgi:isoquinoline 1-oxidoreductase beta subunit
MGGGFGRKEEVDFAEEAAFVADALGGGPVQLLWTRDDDLTHDCYHPASRHRMSAEFTARGVKRWRHRIAAPSAEKQWTFGSSRHIGSIPKAETSGAWNLPYLVPHFLVEYVDPPLPIRLGFWRGIEISSNVFAVESFVDELAHAARRDPLEFRLSMFGDGVLSTRVTTPFSLARLRSAFELAAAKSDWRAPLPAGSGRGIAGAVFDGHSAAASVAEVTVRGGELRVDRVVCAIDCGLVVNPLGLEGTVQSAVAWALSALFSEITFEQGRSRQSTLLAYPLLRFNRMPKVEVHAVPSTENPSGAGEIPVPTIAPAIANAIFAATGRRLRRLPLRPEDFA